MTKTRSLVATLAICLIALAGAFGVSNPNTLSYSANLYQNWHGYVINGNSVTGSQTILVQLQGIQLPSQSNPYNPLGGAPGEAFVPILVDADAVTPTAVSCGIPAPTGVNVPGNGFLCNVTASFGAIHGNGSPLSTNDAGLQEAANDAWLHGGGVVVVDGTSGATQALLAAVTPYHNVSFEDRNLGQAQFWTITQKAATVLAAPTTLVNATAGFSVAGANLTGGSYTGSSTYIACIAYVDPAGQEGPCSATFTIATSGSAATDQIGFTAPAASAGAVGYTIYIDLAGGTYNLTYQVPLTASVCTLTPVETVTPACAVTNATYNQTGSAAIVSALTVNTAPLHLLATTASTTSAYIGTPNGRTTYAYAPHNAVGIPGVPAANLAFAIAPATATTVPSVVGTINLPAGIINYPGRQFRVCGKATEATAGSTATVQNFEFLWDGAGSDTAGAPVIIGQLQLTATLVTANADNWSFCETFQTTVAGAGVTAGSVMPVNGTLTSTYGAGVLGNTGVDVNVAAVGSLNLAGTAGNTTRLHVVWLHTTNTDANGVTLQGLTVEAL